MKRILIVCLLGMGLLLPVKKITAKEFFTKRIVDVWMEGAVLRATSDDNTGGITLIQIFDLNGNLVKQKTYSPNFSCYIGITELPGGFYVAKVTTTLTSYTESFTVG
ncbi:MAG: hypothetical protein V4615_01750 [Bacteroidota bacterium]